MSCGEFWLELKVCKTKKYKTAGLWRPHQVAWQFNRSKVLRNVWNVVSHPEEDKIYLYGCDKIVDLNEPDKNVRPDFVLTGWPLDWSKVMEFIRSALTDATNSTAIDYECADA